MNGLLPRAARLIGIPCALGGAALWLSGCAHVEAPSGGPVDATPPAVAAVYPAPGATGVPRDARTVFQFSEWIDRNAARGTVMISPPYPGRARVEADGDQLTMLPPAGQSLRPNATHVVTVLGTLKDLRGNAMGKGFSLRFSTGPALDSATVAGRLAIDGRRGNLVAALYHAGDRTGPALNSAAIAALSPRDTGFRASPSPQPWRELPAYLAGADSSGDFLLDGAAAGDYALFAFEDLNGNFAFDMGLEAAATGEPSLTLRPVKGETPDQTLRLVPLDTMPLRLAEAVFAPDQGPADDTAAEYLPGVVRVKFSRAAHPARAAEASRYLVLPDSGEPLAVTGAGWSPEHEAWVLETPPLRANARHRVAVRGRPDFPGRHGAEGTDGTGETDTSAVFVAERPAAGAKPVDWIAAPVRLPGAGPSGLPQAATSLLEGADHAFASTLPLTPERWRLLETSLETRARFAAADTVPVPVPHRLQRVSPVIFTVRPARPLQSGSELELRLRPAPGDTSPPRALYAGAVPDSAQTGRLRLIPPANRRDWTFWVQPASGSNPPAYALRGAGNGSRDTLESVPLPAGRYRVHAFRDRDGDGVWNPGALKPWIPQEPFETLLDSVTVVPGKVTDVTERLAP